MDQNEDGFVDQKEFIHAMLKIYYSKLESKLKLVFDFYDFDKDGYISKEDIRLILSHIPIEVLGDRKVEGEGKFTQEGGASADYQQRIEMQEEILKFINTCFESKERLSVETFSKIN